jgi:hypothetical protein
MTTRDQKAVTFHCVCEMGTVKDVEEYLAVLNIRAPVGGQHVINGFQAAVLAGNTDVAQWLDAQFQFRTYMTNNTASFYMCMRHGDYDAARIMYPEITSEFFGRVMEDACRDNDVRTAAWLLDTYVATHVIIPSCQLWFDCAHIACQHQYVETVHFLLNCRLPPHDLYFDDGLLFRIACSLPSDDIVQMLYADGGVNVRARNDEALCVAMEGKYIRRSEWLMSLGCDPFAHNDTVLKSFCLDLGRRHMFYECDNGDAEVTAMQWLLDVYRRRGRAIPDCCKWVVRKFQWVGGLRKMWITAVVCAQ